LPFLKLGEDQYILPVFKERLNKGERQEKISKLIKPLGLSRKEKKDLLAFLDAISAPPVPFTKPILPE